jgi:hypothetical protein
VEDFSDQFFITAANKAGLRKGTTVVDNDLIEQAFLTGAGLAAGFLAARLDADPVDMARATIEVIGMLERCVDAPVEP